MQSIWFVPKATGSPYSPLEIASSRPTKLSGSRNQTDSSCSRGTPVKHKIVGNVVVSLQWSRRQTKIFAAFVRFLTSLPKMNPLAMIMTNASKAKIMLKTSSDMRIMVLSKTYRRDGGDSSPKGGVMSKACPFAHKLESGPRVKGPNTLSGWVPHGHLMKN